jgi:hypothetical protein
MSSVADVFSRNRAAPFLVARSFPPEVSQSTYTHRFRFIVFWYSSNSATGRPFSPQPHTLPRSFSRVGSP